MRHRSWLFLLTAPALAASPVGAPAQRFERTPDHPTREQIEAQLHYQTGKISVRGGLATLDLPDDFRYLDPRGTDIVLRAWGNPPGSETLGMLVPTALDVLRPEGWGVIITYAEDGYVKGQRRREDRLPRAAGEHATGDPGG